MVDLTQSINFEPINDTEYKLQENDRWRYTLFAAKKFGDSTNSWNLIQKNDKLIGQLAIKFNSIGGSSVYERLKPSIRKSLENEKYQYQVY